MLFLQLLLVQVLSHEYRNAAKYWAFLFLWNCRRVHPELVFDDGVNGVDVFCRKKSGGFTSVIKVMGVCKVEK